MPVLQASALGDLIATTLNELGEMKFTELTTDLTEHVAWGRLVKKNKVTFDAGPAIQWNVMVSHSGAAHFTGLGAVDDVNVGDTQVQANIPWRHVTTNYAIIRQEIAMNRSPRKIVDLLKIRRLDAMISLAETMEGAFWDVPASTDETSPYGVDYWVVNNGSEGFTGTMASGYTDVAGLSTTTYPRWKNYAAPYTAVTKDDLIRKWRTAARKTNFMPPVDGISTFNTGNQYGFYTNDPVIGKLEEALEAQNENLGNDLASKDGSVVFHRVPVTYVPKLNDNSADPIYGINWGVFKTVVLRGEWLNETSIPVSPGQHTVSAVHVDCSMNWICRDRRRNFVLSTTTF